MRIQVRANGKYDEGVHPDVTHIYFMRDVVGDFFNEDRFPNLVVLKCNSRQITSLEVNCTSLQKLISSCNQLTELKLSCPSLQELESNDNQLTNLELNCPSLEDLGCENNQLADLNGLEFCADLKELRCSIALKESAEILKIHLPNLRVMIK